MTLNMRKAGEDAPFSSSSPVEDHGGDWSLVRPTTVFVVIVRESKTSPQASKRIDGTIQGG